MTTIQLEFPEEVFASLRRSPDEFAREMRQAAAIHWYSRGEVSQEQAARVAGMNRVDFLLALGAAGVDTVVVDMQDLKQEIARG